MLVKQRQRFGEKVKSFKQMWANLMMLVSLAGDEALQISAEFFAPLSERVEQHEFGSATRAQAAQNSVNMLVVVGATLIVGVVVYAQIESATPSPDNTDLADAQDSVTDTIASSFDLASVLPIVIIAGAILFFLRGFGGGSMGRR